MGYVVFSDLHCQLKTLDTCFKVLRAVHAVAIKEKRTVVFLGDFFNSVYCKASISVELLNKLVAYFSSEWTAKSYFLVGNHDMPLLTNIDNGLRVFEKVNEAIKVVEVPGVHENALFIPYLHDKEDILKAIRTYSSSAKIILAHAEFKGALLNTSVRSIHGLDTEAMPLPVLSGHLHMPQDGRVVYCGSPYQCSLGEAGQNKRFLRYSCDWERQEDIPISFGTRYYKIKPTQDLKRRFSDITKCLKPNDVVVLDGLDSKCIPEELVSSWKDVVVRRKTKRLKRVIHKATASTPTEQFRNYMSLKDPKLLEEGLAMITHGAARENDPIVLEFHALQMVHFGPFKDPQTFDLKSGLTLVTASRNLKDSHLSSNGAGKSLLVCGAFLWVLTGEADPRPTMQSSVSGASKAVVHHGCDFASVTLRGTRNGTPFSITRRMSTVEKVKHRISMSIGGEDRTHSVLKQTQLCINQTLFNLRTSPVKSPGKALRHFILRTIMWNQHTMPRFADASAKDTKTELGWLIDASEWQKLSDKCKGEVSHLRSEMRELKTDIGKDSVAIAHLEHNLYYEENSAASWEKNREESTTDSQRLLCTVEDKLMCCKEQPPLRTEAARALQQVLAEKKYLELLKPCEVKRALPSIEQLEEKQAKMTQDRKKTMRLLSSALERRARAVERKSVSNRRLHNFRSRSGDFCDQCQQRVPIEHRERMLRKMEKEHTTNTIAFQTCSNEYTKLQKQYKCQGSFLQENERLQKLRHRQLAALVAVREYTKARGRLKEIRLILPAMKAAADGEEKHNNNVRDAERDIATLHTEQAYLKRELDRFKNMNNPHSARVSELGRKVELISSRLRVARQILGEREATFFTVSNLTHHFGKDGIQPALTQAVLQRVENLCATYFGALHSTQKAMTLDCQKYSKSIQEGEWNTPVNLLSGGELRRLQIASFLAFSQLTLEKANVSMDLRIFDEPCAPLDAAGQVAFLKQIKELYPTHKSILISHADIPENHADRRVNIKSRGLHRSSIV